MNLAVLFFAVHLHSVVVLPRMEHKFYDRPAKIELIAAVTLNAADNLQACHNLARGGREAYLPSQTCSGVTALLGAQLIAQELAAYWLHRMHRHKLERCIRFFTIEGNVQGLIYSKMHGAF
jgi:hypothetical protein